jgi:hypothetical protein
VPAERVEQVEIHGGEIGRMRRIGRIGLAGFEDFQDGLLFRESDTDRMLRTEERRPRLESAHRIRRRTSGKDTARAPQSEKAFHGQNRTTRPLVTKRRIRFTAAMPRRTS